MGILVAADPGNSNHGQPKKSLRLRESSLRGNNQAESSSLRNLTLAVAWSGLPPYGLNAIRAVVARFGVEPIVLGTPPDMSYDAIGKVAGVPIHWIDPVNTSINWIYFSTKIPDVLLVSGWATPAFNKLGRQVRENGGAVIVMVDNRWRGDLRQRVAPVVFNTKYRNWFQAAIVPGKSARRFVRYLGLPDSAIHEGLYGGNPNIFVPGPPLADRPRRFLFVGRFEERKGIRELAEAWRAIQPQLPDWELHAVGEGGLRPLLEGVRNVVLHPFKQLTDLAECYGQSRFLVLPSREDHWGVVVHEATRCGCGLLLSENVGARDDLANRVNSFLFPPGRPSDIANAMLRAAQLGESQLRGVYHESLALAYRFGPSAFADAVHRAVAGLPRRG